MDLRRKGVRERKVFAITKLYKNTGASAKIKVKVRVHQNLVLSSLLFEVIMDEITKDVRENGVNKRTSAC